MFLPSLLVGRAVSRLREDVARYCRMCNRSATVSFSAGLAAFLSPRMAPVVLLRVAEMTYSRRPLRLFAKFFAALGKPKDWGQLYAAKAGALEAFLG